MSQRRPERSDRSGEATVTLISAIARRAGCSEIVDGGVPAGTPPPTTLARHSPASSSPTRYAGSTRAEIARRCPGRTNEQTRFRLRVREEGSGCTARSSRAERAIKYCAGSFRNHGARSQRHPDRARLSADAAINPWMSARALMVSLCPQPRPDRRSRPTRCLMILTPSSDRSRQR